MKNNVINLNTGGPDKLLITHTDLDGIGCAVVFLKAYPRGTAVFLDNHNVNEGILEVLEADNGWSILISDLSVSPEVAKKLDARGKVGLLDHHKTAEWMADRYPWAKIDLTKCGTRLVYEMLNGQFNLEDLEDFVDTVEDWDLWGKGDGPGPDAIRYNLMFEFLGRQRFVRQAFQDPYFVESPEWDWLISTLMDRYEGYYQTTKRITQIHTKDGYQFGITIADQYVSLMGSRLHEELNLEYIMLIDSRRATASLRGKGNVDLSDLAKQAGGGGHRRAAGFSLGYRAAELVQNLTTTEEEPT